MDTQNVKVSKSPEVILTEAAKPAILAVQLNANVPLSLVRGKLCKKYLSLSFMLQCIMHIFFISSMIYMGLNSEKISNFHVHYSSTEYLLMKIVGPINILFAAFSRLYGFSNRHATLQFWKSNVAILDSFLRDSPTQAVSTLEKRLARIRTSLRNYFATLLVLIICTHFTAHYFYRGFYPDFPGDLNLSFHFAMLATLSQAAHGIWLSFFLKYYTVLFESIQQRLRILNQSFSEINLNTIESLNISGDGRIEAELNASYNLFIKVRSQVQDFCSHFQINLLTDSFLSSFHVIFCIFICLRWLMESEFETKRIGSLSLLLQAVTFGKLIYYLGTDGSRLQYAASKISEELHDLYNKTGSRLSFRCRQTLQIFLMKISTNPPVVDVAQFFIIDRQWISGVRF